MGHKKASGCLGVILLAGGIGLAALLLNSEKADSIIENAVDNIKTSLQRATVIDYFNSLDYTSKERLIDTLRSYFGR
jgi:hypothetical protein